MSGTELVHSSYVAEMTAEIMRLKAALVAAEARERKSYLLLARWLDKEPHDGGTLAAETRSHLDAILDAIHALGRERNA